MLEQTCARARQLLPQNAPIGVYALRNLAVTLRLLGEMDEALALNKETLPVLVERLGTDRPTALAFRALVLAHQALARSGESRPDPVEDASQSKKMRSPRRLP
ncbi:tetratricopeptide repeat protein [Streptomyces antimycoticus]|uniref:tetratricopeptide repeat protein n=1 Tax=Streptomyces antimycoticus TaxID=68175 RepID=UPI0037FF0C90